MIPLKEKEIHALITLLGDDDFRIKAIAKKKLVDAGPQACALLAEVGGSDVEGRIRIEAQILLEELRLEALAEQFKKLNSYPEFDLEKACFILAQIEYHDLDTEPYVKQIDRLALTLQKRIKGVRQPRKKVEAINHLLFHESHFRGNVNDYYDPENSYITRVLDRHLGIPISLSALYMFIARRLDLGVYGVGFPGHFMVKFREEGNWYFVDSFNKGIIRTRSECRRFLQSQGFPYQDSYTVAMKPRDMMARMIRNLILIYHQNSQTQKVDILEKIFSDFVLA